MDIIKTRYALRHFQTGAWREAGNSLANARRKAEDGWELMEYDIQTGWKHIAKPKYYNTQRRVAAAGGY